MTEPPSDVLPAVREAIGLLREMEWPTKDWFGDEYCRICGGYHYENSGPEDNQAAGHAADCRLAALLAKND